MAELPRNIPIGRLSTGLGIQAVSLVAAGLAMWGYSGRELTAFIDLGWLPAMQGLMFGGVLIGSAAATFRLFPGLLEKTTHLQAKMAGLFTAQTNLPVFVWIALCAGIGEEAAFRAGLMTLTGNAIGIPAAVVVSALAFALIHLAKPLITAAIVVIGIVFGLVYWWTGSLLTVMIGHAVYDIWALHTLHRELLRLGYLDDPEGSAASLES